MQSLESAVLERVGSAVSVVAAKASPAEAEACTKMLASVAEQDANASKEGGFPGLGGARMSDKKHAFISGAKAAASIA